MDISKLTNSKEFSLCNLRWSVEYYTQTSVVFALYQHVNKDGSLSESYDDLTVGSSCGGLYGCGTVSLHFPCEGYIKTLLIMDLPERFHDNEKVMELFDRLLELLSIPKGEPFVVRYFVANEECEISSPLPGVFYNFG